jgi:AraC-like DNA-binding protein
MLLTAVLATAPCSLLAGDDAVEAEARQILENSMDYLSGLQQFGLVAHSSIWRPLSVKLQRREPRDRTPYRRLFRAPVYFDSTCCEVTFNNYCLEKSPPTADALLFRHLMQEAELLHDLQHGELTHALPSVLQRGLLSGRFSAPEIAEVFGIHQRTLHRRLRAAKTSFRVELDAARRRLSEQLLSNTSLPVGDIATTLGYADASGFIRAFERWCGTTPASWRRQHFASQDGDLA